MRFTLEDSRRLTGPNLLSPGPGAILDVRVEDGTPERLVTAWEQRVHQMLEAIGWSAERTFTRVHRDGVDLAISAPIDALYAATGVNEWALAAAVADIAGRAPADEPAQAARRLAAEIAAESNSALLGLRDAAAARGVMFLSDDETASVGMGAGSWVWPIDDLPRPEDVDWPRVHDIPLALVTGTNGKTTTVRLLAAMLRAGGRRPGFSSTDGVYVGDEQVQAGDFSGPGGARSVLRDRRVEAAVLETARGGMLRRGLGVPRADGVAVTNVGADHVGEYGLYDVEGIAAAKLVVARAVAAGGRLVLNADDAALAGQRPPGAAELVWTSRCSAADFVARNLAAGGEAVLVEDGAFIRRRGSSTTRVLGVDEAPITLGGAAAFNVENALVALALAPAVGVSDEAAAAALAGFEPSAEGLPGRSNLFRLGGATLLVDFVHNPHGMNALAETVLRLPARRRLVVLGQAGDRDDASIRALVRAACRMRPDRIVAKELPSYLRGRGTGEIPRLIREEVRATCPRVEVVDAADDLEAVRSALEWCADGDLLVLAVHAQRDEVIGWLASLDRMRWRPGRALPPPAGGPEA